MVGFISLVCLLPILPAYFDSYSSNRKKHATIAASVGLILIIIVQFLGYNFHVSHLYDLQIKKEIHIENKLELLRTLNTKVLIEMDKKEMIVNVANMGQSVKTSEVWQGVLDNISSYNRSVGNYLYAKEYPIRAFLVNGFYPKEYKNLKYIRLQEINPQKGK